MSISVNQNTINAKSINVIIAGDIFKSTDSFTVTNTSTTTPTTLTIDSVVYSNDFITATLIFADSSLLELGSSYKVDVKRTLAVIGSTNFTYSDIISIDSATLTCNGTRFFTLTFEYPVKFDDCNTPTTDAVSPFYALPDNLPIGLPNLPISSNYGFLWSHSANLNSINIESTQNSFNIGDISLFTNFPTSGFSNTSLAWAKEYEVGNTNIPTILSKGTVPAVSKTQTEVCNFSQYNGSKSSLVATFCNPILFLAQSAKLVDTLQITLDSFTATVTSVSRPDYNSPNQLVFNLSAELLPGIYNVAVSSILDANGNPTKVYNGLLVVKDVSPEVELADAPNALTVILGYNTLMNVTSDSTEPDFSKSALNPNNYSLSVLTGDPYTGSITAVTDITLSGATKTKVSLTLSEPLAYGEYEITVNNVVSRVNSPLIVNTASFIFDDQSETTVTIIGYNVNSDANPSTSPFNANNQKIIAAYNKAMDIGITEHSADNPLNFLVKVTPNRTPFYPLDDGTVITNVSTPSNYQDKFRIPLNTTLDLSTVNMGNFRLSVGYNEYINGHNISRAVESTSGSQVKIDDLGYAISHYAKPMTFCDTTYAHMYLILPNQILYSYEDSTNYNEFFEVKKENLTFTLSGGIAEPEEIFLASSPVADGKQILFTFTSPINVDALNLTITQSTEGSIKDFFDGNVIMTGNTCTLSLQRDKVQPIVKAASLVSIDSNNTKVALFFNKQMKYTDNDDFVIYDNLYSSLQVPEARILVSGADPANVPNPPFDASYYYLPEAGYLSIIEINGKFDSYINSNNAQLTVQTNLHDLQLSTEDINTNTIKQFTKSITNFITKSFTIELANGNTGETSTDVNSIFKLSFDRKLNVEWFNGFKFATPDSNGLYSLKADLAAYYVDSTGQKVPFTNGDTIPANILIVQTITVRSTTEAKNVVGVITSNYYSMLGSQTIDLSTKDATLSFSSDQKSIIISVKSVATKDYIKGLIVATGFMEPTPYVLAAADEMVFVNTSFKAKDPHPIASFTPLT